MLEKIKKFFSEVWIELKKVSWPTPKELKDSTVVVIVAVAVLGMYIAVIDQLSAIFIKIILK